jgi:hypothetical protein
MILCVLAASSKFPLSEEPLWKELFRLCYRNYIEGIDREFKVTKAQKVYNKRGYVYTSFRGYENPRLNLMQSLSRIMN